MGRRAEVIEKTLATHRSELLKPLAIGIELFLILDWTRNQVEFLNHIFRYNTAHDSLFVNDKQNQGTCNG